MPTKRKRVPHTAATRAIKKARLLKPQQHTLQSVADNLHDVTLLVKALMQRTATTEAKVQDLQREEPEFDNASVQRYIQKFGEPDSWPPRANDAERKAQEEQRNRELRAVLNRMPVRNKDAWNLACDHIVNDMLHNPFKAAAEINWDKKGIPVVGPDGKITMAPPRNLKDFNPEEHNEDWHLRNNALIAELQTRNQWLKDDCNAARFELNALWRVLSEAFTEHTVGHIRHQVENAILKGE
jgi:hypothetical protein